jgi:uncharacterized coiled-coil DUF342 family protein
MPQLHQERSEPAARGAEGGADRPEPSKTQDLVSTLRHCSGVLRQQLERAQEHLRHITSLADELREARSENDRLRAALEDVHNQVTDGVRREDALRAEATAERDRAAGALAARSDLERHLVEVEDRLRTATEKLDQLESAAQQAARERAAESEHDIAQKSKRGEGELEAARLRIEQLVADLHWARSANERLRSLLNVFGVVDHLESRRGAD